ncbi:MAG: 3-methyl-2-oxobutanoate hydroxymethyltransferase [Bacteroidota bacterium]
MNATSKNKKITSKTIREMKKQGERIVALTAYDFLLARLLDQSGIDIVLVGDSLSNVFQGNETTLPVTIDEMIYHTKAVRRGVRRAMVVVDMPFLSYQIDEEDALRNCGRVLKESGAEAVKIEGGNVIASVVKRLVAAGIPVMGHLGLTPQSIHVFGGYDLQARNSDAAAELLDDAHALQDAGAFAIVLEKIPAKVAIDVSRSLEIPTIGIGAGAGCDGQVLVTYDMLGLNEEFRPKFVRHYIEGSRLFSDAFERFINDVKKGKYPSESESY